LSFEITRLVGRADALHHRPLEAPVRRSVVVLELERPALVLGSTQRETDADQLALDAFGVDLCRRRSGGGAVYLVPGETMWVDVELPRDDPLWDEDVARSFHWLGHAWAAALADLGVAGVVHTSGAVETAWSRRVCFGGLGAGEVTVYGRKLVGLSQRRTRDGARFQCVVHRRWDVVPILGLLALHHRERAAALLDLSDVATGIDADHDRIVDALVHRLP
jgi:lipoate---protein ligase